MISVASEGSGGFSPRWIERLLTRALATLRVRRADLSVALVSTATSRRLNRTYRDRDRATNILSFSLTDRRNPAVLQGELVLCLPVIRREAPRFGRSVNEHLALLLIHGLLHLKGFDHVRRTDQDRMERFEQRLLRVCLPKSRS